MNTKMQSISTGIVAYKGSRASEDVCHDGSSKTVKSATVQLVRNTIARNDQSWYFLYASSDLSIFNAKASARPCKASVISKDAINASFFDTENAYVVLVPAFGRSDVLLFAMASVTVAVPPESTTTCSPAKKKA